MEWAGETIAPAGSGAAAGPSSAASSGIPPAGRGGRAPRCALQEAPGLLAVDVGQLRPMTSGPMWSQAAREPVCLDVETVTSL